MENSNDNAEVVQPKDDKPAPVEKVEPKPESTDYRPKLSDEEQLAILEGRAKRLKTKLGIKDEAPTKSSEPDALSQKAYLAARSITASDEVDLALAYAKKFGMSVDQVVDDEDFVAKLDKHRTTKANAAAVADVKGGGNGESSAKQTAAYWMSKGTPPTAADVPDLKTRAAIHREMMQNAGTSGKKFYNS